MTAAALEILALAGAAVAFHAIRVSAETRARRRARGRHPATRTRHPSMRRPPSNVRLIDPDRRGR